MMKNNIFKCVRFDKTFSPNFTFCCCVSLAPHNYTKIARAGGMLGGVGGVLGVTHLLY